MEMLAVWDIAKLNCVPCYRFECDEAMQPQSSRISFLHAALLVFSGVHCSTQHIYSWWKMLELCVRGARLPAARLVHGTCEVYYTGRQNGPDIY